MSIPTMDELLARLRTSQNPLAIREVCRRIASGERDPECAPNLRNVILLACQSMVILWDHALSDPSTRRDNAAWCPEVCPITLLPFFMWISHPDLGIVPTYGGPYDSYTIPEPELSELPCKRFEVSYYRHRYDHDLGGWHDGVEQVEHRVISEEHLIDLGAWDED